MASSQTVSRVSVDSDFDPATHLTLADQRDLVHDAKLEETEVTSKEFDTASLTTTLAPGPDSFAPTKTLTVWARGVPLVRLPLPSTELELRVEDVEKPGQSAYVSTRQKTCSGNAILSAPGRGDLVQSIYKFGPGRAPRLILLQQGGVEIKIKGKWMSREQSLTLSGQDSEKEKNLTWRYRKELRPGSTINTSRYQQETSGTQKEPKPRRFLVCESSGVRVAMLLRDEETRTPGTRNSSAGNGGDLVIDENALGLAGLSEELVVASCIMMLKKEIDRRRALQFAVMAGLAGGS